MITILVFYNNISSKTVIDDLILDKDDFLDKNTCVFFNIRETKLKKINVSIKTNISDLLDFEFSSKTILNIPFNSYEDAVNYFNNLSTLLNRFRKNNEIIVYYQYLTFNRELVYSYCTRNKHFQNKIRKYYPQIYSETDYSEYTDSEETLDKVVLIKKSRQKVDYSSMELRRSERLKLKISTKTCFI